MAERPEFKSIDEAITWDDGYSAGKEEATAFYRRITSRKEIIFRENAVDKIKNQRRALRGLEKKLNRIKQEQPNEQT